MKIILTTIDKEEKADKIAETLLKEKLVACINTRKVRSQYRWKDKIEKEDEYQLFIKTKESLVDEVIEKIKQIHDYDLPVIEVLSVEKTNEGVEDWLNEVTK